MATGQMTAVLQHIHALVGRTVSEDSSDADLLEQFVYQGDEAAFGALVRRHGALVLRVCRRVLHDSHAAEDAFQATFVILARKAGSIRRQESVASWLYAVAYRAASKARCRGARRQACEQPLTDVPAASLPADDPWLREVLAEELHRLSAKLRAPLILCYLEGKTYGQAARELGWSEGSMSRRLAQARERLRQRLQQRGVVLGGAALLAALQAESAEAASPLLLDGLGQAALTGGSGSTRVLAQGVLHDMLLTKLHTAAALFLAFGLALGGTGLLWQTKSEAANDGAQPLVALADRAAFFVPDNIALGEDCPEEEALIEMWTVAGATGDLPQPAGSDREPDPMPALSDELLLLPAPSTLAMKRRQLLGETELRRQLLQMTELQLETEPGRTTSLRLGKGELGTEPTTHRDFIPNYLATRADLVGLPLLKGGRCETEATQVAHLRELSRSMRTLVGEAVAGTDSQEAVGMTLRVNLRKDGKQRRDTDTFQNLFLAPRAVPTMMQMLPAEGQPVRRVLVEQLARIDDPASTQALAKLAAFDIAPEVRTQAVEVLLRRPVGDARPVLLEALRYPWAPVADHAAEALVALRDRAAIPALQELLKQGDPRAPFVDPETKQPVVREVVRLNHLRNCLMCHAVSQGNAGGSIVAPVPDPEKPLPPPASYYHPVGDLFVRAEVTYLRQDFSVSQPVQNTKHWPTMQRFDYLVRLRPVTSSQASGPARASYPQRDAVLFALKELEAP